MKAHAPRLRVLAVVAALWVAGVAAVYYAPALAQCAAGRGGCEWWVDSFEGDRSLPFLGEAVRAAAGALAAAALLVASATLLGAALCRLARCPFEGRAEALAYQAAVGVGAFAYVGLALATVGLYRPAVLRVAAALPLLGGAVALAARRLARGRAAGRAPRLAEPRPAGGDRLWAACALLLALSSLAAALAPEIQYDAVWFHLYFPRLFLEHGRLVDLPAEYVSLYPMTWELWFGYGLAVGGSGAATLLHFACLPLAAAATYALARLAAPQASPWLAAALFVAVPTVLWEGSTAYLDLALALHVTLLLHALLRYVATRRWQWLALAAVNLGLALATKHLSLVVLALVCPGLAVALWWRDRRAAREGASAPARPLARALGAAAVLGLAALLFPLPWYARSWLATGNPVFPELFGLFGGPPTRWDAASDAGLRRFFARFGYPRTVANQLALPWHATMHAARFGGTPGPLLLALVPLVALRRPRRGAGWLAAFAAGYVALWASPLASFQFRWLVPALPVFAVLGALGAARLAALLRAASGPAAARAASFAIAALLLLDAPVFTGLQMRDREGWTGWLTHTLNGLPLGVVLGGESREAYLERNVPTYRAWRWANDSLPPAARLLVYGGGDHLYSARERIGAFATPARRTAFALAGEEDAALRGLHSLGVTHLLVDERFLATNGMAELGWDDFALTSAATRASAYDVVYRDGRCTIYRLRDVGTR